MFHKVMHLCLSDQSRSVHFAYMSRAVSRLWKLRGRENNFVETTVGNQRNDGNGEHAVIDSLSTKRNFRYGT